MRFVSKYKRYMINFQVEIVEHYATGQSREVQPLLNCEFDRWGSLHPWEVQAALSHWQVNREGGFQGLTVDEDEMTLERPEGRLSVFDTDQFAKSKGLSDERKRELEEFLLSRPEHGQDYIRIEAPALVPPWPNYDRVKGGPKGSTAVLIARKVQEDGYNIDSVLAYERQGKNRQDVIDAVEALRVPEPEDEPLIAA